jgi:sarcosine oxidase
VIGSAIARELAGRAWRVTLVDRYPSGHARAASAAESRLIRSAHGPDERSTRSAWRALALWREIEREAGDQLLIDCGVVWFARPADGWEAESERILARVGVACERLTPAEAARAFLSFDGTDLLFALYEPAAGVIRAPNALRALRAQAVARGARFIESEARPLGMAVLVGDDVLAADCVVWACGPWLATLFPNVIDVQVRQQEVFFFGAPREWRTPSTPAWLDQDSDVYGVGDLGSGFEVAMGRAGVPVHPDDHPAPASLAERDARSYLARRFPALARAPLRNVRACLSTATGELVVAPHPEHASVWLVGREWHVQTRPGSRGGRRRLTRERIS